MRARFVAAVMFVALCGLAHFISDHLGSAYGQPVSDKKCRDTNCDKAPGWDVNCTGDPNSENTCILSNSKANIQWCESSKTNVCNVIAPPVPQTCTGSCKADLSKGCSVIFNKCK